MKYDPHRSPMVYRNRAEIRRRAAVSLALLTTSVMTLATGALFTLSAHASTNGGASGRNNSDSAPTVERVSYRDLDLTQRQHIAILKKRLETAARAVCQSTEDINDNDRYFAPSCFVQAMSDGERQLDRAVAMALAGRGNVELDRSANPARSTGKSL